MNSHETNTAKHYSIDAQGVESRLRADNARLRDDNAELRVALGACLEVWERNHLENHVPGGRYIDDIVRRALAAAESATGHGSAGIEVGN